MRGSNQLSFESEGLVVDYISFKFQDLDNRTMMKIANYLFELGFNSFQESGKLAKPIKEYLLISLKNKYEVIFVNEGPHWKGTTLQFSGINAFIFYAFVQKNLINWKIFSSGVLNRFDIYYNRKYKSTDKILATDFLENCHRKLKQTNKNVNFEKNTRGLILKIGNRRSNNYSRIYEGKGFLKFEHEMKGKFLQKYHSLLVSNNLGELEQKFSFHFLLYFGKSLSLYDCYTDWLVIKLRPIRQQIVLKNNFNSDYMRKASFSLFTERKNCIDLWQFLLYVKGLNFEKDYLGSTSYRQVVFRAQDFLKYKNPSCKSTNQYQMKKLINFFYELQINSLVTSFTDNHFRSLITIPEVVVEKSKQNCWVVKIWVANELFNYQYPFIFPNFFNEKMKKDEFEVRFKLLQVFSSTDISKEFFIKEFFDSYSSVVSNQQKKNMKKSFIKLIKILKESDLIEDDYQIFSNGHYHKTPKLTTKNISEGFTIYEKISL